MNSFQLRIKSIDIDKSWFFNFIIEWQFFLHFNLDFCLKIALLSEG